MRDRGIRAGTWLSRSFARLEPAVALTFIGLWNYADDFGRFDADPGMVWASLYTIRTLVAAEDRRPDLEVTQVEVVAHLDAMRSAGRLCSYLGCDGKTYMHIVGWDEEQDLRYQKASRIPPCRAHEPQAHCWRHRKANPTSCASSGAETVKPDVVDTDDLENRDEPVQPAESFADSKTSEIRLDKTRQDKTETTTDVVVSSRTSRRATQLPGDFAVTDEMRQWATRLPLVDVDPETEQWRDYHAARGDTAKDWTASWRTWMRNAQKYAQRDARIPAGHSPPLSTTDQRVAQGQALILKFGREAT